MRTQSTHAKAASRGHRSSKPVAGKGSAKATTDHEFIRSWVEQRGGHPATVRGTEREGQEAGLLRIDFPGYSGQETLEQISWDEWFDKFDEKKLALIYQEETKSGDTSRFAKLVSRGRGGQSPRSASRRGGRSQRSPRARGR